MPCDHLWTGWMTTGKVLGGLVLMTVTRTCVHCGTVEDSDGHQHPAAAAA